MALLAYGGRSTEDTTLGTQPLALEDMPVPRTWALVDTHPSAAEPGVLGPWPPTDGTTGLSDVNSIYGGGAHLL